MTFTAYIVCPSTSEAEAMAAGSDAWGVPAIISREVQHRAPADSVVSVTVDAADWKPLLNARPGNWRKMLSGPTSLVTWPD